MKFNIQIEKSIYRVALVLAVCLLFAGCVPESEQQISTRPDTSDSGERLPLPQTVVPDESAPTELSIIPDSSVEEEGVSTMDQPSAWEYITQSIDDPQTRNSNLIKAANVLLNENRLGEAQAITELIQINELKGPEVVNYEILRVRFFQFSARHQRAYRTLRNLEKTPLLDSQQRLRVARLKVYSVTHLNQPTLLIEQLIRLYSLLPPGSDRTETGHQLWSTLGRVSIDDLAATLTETKYADAKPWILLALGTNLVRHDPYQFNNALRNWMEKFPDHPAGRLIESGISSAGASYSKIAALLPLSSENSVAAQTFLDGLSSQHSADSNPDKPQLVVIDIGNDPSQVTLSYYQALADGANFIIGPLGVNFVNEMVKFGDFVVPTLLLGEAEDAILPPHVHQFALAPEYEGITVARRARQDGHTTALILEIPSKWSARAVEAFRDEWEQLGGVVIDSQVYNRNENDYSETVKEILNIDSSVARYQVMRDLIGRSMKFISRRRQDAGFIFLTADPLHGRLIKPHIDFLKAHDLPVYGTSHIYSGSVDKIQDQDLDGVQFSDMDWIINQSDPMKHLRQKLASRKTIQPNFQRIFAMGADTYNLVSRLDVLREDSDARYHGVTSMMRLNTQGRVFRLPMWAKFTDGTPELITTMADPERNDLPVRYFLSSEPIPAERQ